MRLIIWDEHEVTGQEIVKAYFKVLRIANLPFPLKDTFRAASDSTEVEIWYRPKKVVRPS